MSSLKRDPLKRENARLRHENEILKDFIRQIMGGIGPAIPRDLLAEVNEVLDDPVKYYKKHG